MIQITPIHGGPYAYCKKLHKKYIFMLTQKFPFFVWDGHWYNVTLQNDIQTFEFIDAVRKKKLLTHLSLEISNKFRKNKQGGEYSTSYKYFTLQKSFL